jgi:geranylgeranyl diphosphate synthase type II
MSTQLKSSAECESLWDYVAATRPGLEEALSAHLPAASPQIGTLFNEALRYALFPGGKRLRPVLTMLGAELVGGRPEDVLRAAVAVEYIHTSSLIFDDLPCMDDAAERRGRTALHARYGEGLAILVALALMNASYGLVFSNVRINMEHALAAHAELVEGIGARGMVAGQSVDLTSANLESDRADFERLRNLKTSALIRMALRLGAILSGANDVQLGVIARYAELLGDAYQTSDDLLDMQEDLSLIEAAAPPRLLPRRATFALERGAGDAILRIAALTSEAKYTLVSEFGATSTVNLLSELADYVVARAA